MDFLSRIYIQKFHEDKIAKYGSVNVKSLAWFDEESQIKRFEILAQIGDLNNSTILDVGCGNGDFCVYLSKHFSNFTYHGLDIVSEFLDNAVDRTKEIPNTPFYLADFMAIDLPPVDYVFASGSLNYKNSDPDFIYKAITKLFSACKKGFAFNLLSETPNVDGILCAYRPNDIMAFGETLSKDVQMIEGYAKGDFTLLMRCWG